jgi:hypothetical protein
VLRITITGTGDVCQATLGFRNQKGAPIPEDGRVRRVTLKKDESAVHDLNFNAFVNRLGQRFEARAVVIQDPTVPSSCIWSVEVFDQFSKRTSVIYIPVPGDGQAIPDDGHFPPIGGAFGQTVRLGVSALPMPDDGSPAAPCEAEVHFHSGSGALLGSRVMKVAPGEADVFDLSMNGLVRFAERGIIEPCVMPVAPGSAAGCRVSVQVFDQLTGWTQAFMAPVF